MAGRGGWCCCSKGGAADDVSRRLVCASEQEAVLDERSRASDLLMTRDLVRRPSEFCKSLRSTASNGLYQCVPLMKSGRFNSRTGHEMGRSVTKIFSALLHTLLLRAHALFSNGLVTTVCKM